MRKFLYAIAIIMVLLVSACAAQPQKQPAAEPEKKAEVVALPPAEVPQEPVKPKSTEIRLLKKGVEPLESTISAGTSVTWINNGGVSTLLNINKDNKFFMRSNLLKNGDKFEQELKEKGAYVFWGESY